MAWQGYNEDDWNADDYMSDLDELMEEGGGTTMGGLWEAMKADKGVAEKQWMDQEKWMQDWFTESQQRGEKTTERWDAFRESADESYAKQEGLVDDWATSMEERSGLGVDLARDWADKSRAIFASGKEYAGELMKAATAKYEDLEDQMTDYNVASISGLVRGTTARERANITQRQEEARRSGASQSVLDNIAYAGEREISESLQGAIASSQQQWQEQLQQSGRLVAGAYGAEAQFEGGMMGQELGMEANLYAGEAGALDTETSLLMQAGQTRLEFSGMVAEGKTRWKHEQLIAEMSAEDFMLNDMKEFGRMMTERPAVKSANTIAMLLQYQSMPGYKNLKGMKPPSGSEKSPEDKKLMADNPGIDWTKTSIEDFKKMQRARRYGITESGSYYNVSYT